MVFRFTKSFAELLTGKSLPYAQNCPEFGLFSENHQTSGIPRADVGRLEDGLGGCGMCTSWGGRDSPTVGNDSFKDSRFLAVGFS